MKMLFTLAALSFFSTIYAQEYILELPQDTTQSHVLIKDQKGNLLANSNDLKIYTGTVLSMIDQSDLQDKQLISMVLQQYPSNYKFWKEVIALCKTHQLLSDDMNALIEEQLKTRD